MLKQYWSRKINLIYWFKKPKKIINKKLFFTDGLTNIAYNCVKKI